MNTLQLIVFYLLLLDSLTLNVLVWSERTGFTKQLRTFSRYFPLTKGWAVWYLLLVLWIGYLTFDK